MSHPKVFFVVGHSNWGKSHTLRELTGGSRYVRRTTISGTEFIVRRMSNDDLPDSFIEKMSNVDPSQWPFIIAALCPDFEDETKKTSVVLNALKRKGYRLFFWVQVQRYESVEEITTKELARLETFGRVKPFYGVAEASTRAKDFEAFVASNIVP